MRRSRAFILSEQLLTIMLQAGFILVLCSSFYLFLSFYAKTNQIISARNHAERVISFVDDKIRNAGLGMWKCRSSAEMRARFHDNTNMEKLQTINSGANERGYKLPIALTWNGNGLGRENVPLTSEWQNSGDVLTLIYAYRDVTYLYSSGQETILTTGEAVELQNMPSQTTIMEGKIKLIDSSAKNMNNVRQHFSSSNKESQAKKYTVAEGIGVPLHVFSIPNNGTDANKMILRAFGNASYPPSNITVPPASELMYFNCMQMFVRDDVGRQFTFRELNEAGNGWNDTYNQEKNILDIYMELDRTKNVFTLWVLATGGYDVNLENPRPDSWPDNANPRSGDSPQSHEDALSAWSASDYRHHIVYVSRASWKLNNIPPNFTW